MARLAIIPARGGSKRIPRKNLRDFRGKPIMAWSIDAALGSRLFDEVMVSTDDPEIADIACAYGARVPFMRSTENASDTATTAAVLNEVLTRYASLGQCFDQACSIYPTAPFVTADDLAQGLRTLDSDDVDVVLPIARFSYPIWRSLKRDTNGRVEMNFPENLNARSQDLSPAYHDAGQWCWFEVAPFLADPVLLGKRTGSVVLPPERVQDIDTEEDWRIAEAKHERLFR